MNIVAVAEVILLARWLGLLKIEQGMGKKVLSPHRVFHELLPQITTDKTWNVSKHVKVAKSNAQWTEVKALNCWSNENETKLEDHFKLFPLHSKEIGLEIVVLANSKKNRNIKANDVNLTSIDGSTDLCFETTYICFCAYYRTYIMLSMFCLWFVTLRKSGFSWPPPPPLGKYCLWIPLPVGISNDLLWRGRGIWIFSGTTQWAKDKSPWDPCDLCRLWFYKILNSPTPFFKT